MRVFVRLLTLVAVCAICVTGAQRTLAGTQSPGKPLAVSSSITSINFDGQSTGPLVTGSASTQFAGVSGGPNLSVVNNVARSAPNALSVSAAGGSGSYAFVRYPAPGYATQALQFSIYLGADLVLPSSDYIVLAQTLPYGSAIAGKVALILAGGSAVSIHLDYLDASGSQHTLWPSPTASLSSGAWHTISIQDVTGSSGSLSLTLDGRVVATASGVNLGSSAIDSFALGDEFSPTDSKIAGHFYLDDVSTSTASPVPTPTPTTPTPTPTGTQATPIDAISFDGQPTGTPVTGSASTQFTALSGSPNLTVENTVARSAPNALSISAMSGGGSFGFVRYPAPGYGAHTLQFSIDLGVDFVLPSSDYIVLAQTLPAGSATAGKVALILTGGSPTSLHLDYVDSSGNQHTLWPSPAASLSSNTWHTITIQDVTGSSGSLSLALDGKVITSASGIDTGSGPVDYFALGDEFSPPDTKIAGHFYIDDVSSTTSTSVPTPTPTVPAPTPTPTTPPPTPTPTGQSTNPVVAENQLSGTTNWIVTKPAQNHEIEGYASSTSVAQGAAVNFSVSTTSSAYTADVYRMGWYSGAGGRLMESLGPLTGSQYSRPSPDPTTGLVQPSWPVAFTVTVPTAWVSGIYMIKLTASSGYQSYIPFTVTDSRSSPLIFVHGVNTDEAYNDWGGKSLYGDDAYPYGSTAWGDNRAYKVTYERPFSAGEDAGAGLFFRWEYPMVRWLERNGYDVSYTTDVAIDQSPSQLLNHKGIIVAGHNEYWSNGIFNAYQAAVGAGVNLAIFAGDVGTWQIRYEAEGSNSRGIEVCYKDASLDPMNGVNNALVTTHFFAPPVNRPTSLFLGEGGPDTESAQVNPPAPWVLADAPNWLVAGTGLQNGSVIPGLVGYEYNRQVPGQPIPSGTTVFASSPVTNVNGNHNISQSTFYTAASGALVLDIGSIEWSWGLDDDSYPFVQFPYSERPSVASSAAQAIAANIMAKFEG